MSIKFNSIMYFVRSYGIMKIKGTISSLLSAVLIISSLVYGANADFVNSSDTNKSYNRTKAI